MDKMTASLESYLKSFVWTVHLDTHIQSRSNVLPESVANYSKDSLEFRSALRNAATVMDCASLDDPFDLQFRTRYIWDSYGLNCKAFFMGLEYPQNATLMQELCPPGECLGTLCPQVRTEIAK